MALYEFTEAERHAIDDVARKISNGETITSDEALLYAKFEANKAVRKSEVSEARELARNESKAAIERAEETARIAREGFESLTALAMERYERTLDNGQ